jgi:hypothetical protein
LSSRSGWWLSTWIELSRSTGSYATRRGISGWFRPWRIVENPWDNRQPFEPSEDTLLESVPGHYKYMLGLPF